MIARKRQCVAFLFASVYAFALLRPFAPWVQYELNYDYIAKELCRNRDMPRLECHGKCFLMQQVQKAEQESAEGHSPVDHIVQVGEYPIGFISDTKTQALSLSVEGLLFSPSRLSLSDPLISEIFRPPEI